MVYTGTTLPFIFLLINSMVHGLFWQGIINQMAKKSVIFMEPKVHCCVYKNLPTYTVLSQITPAHTFYNIYLKSILISPSHLRQGLHSGPLAKTYEYVFIISPYNLPVSSISPHYCSYKQHTSTGEISCLSHLVPFRMQPNVYWMTGER
jgi:hypothetical protein